MAENTYAFDTTDFQLALQTIAFVLLIIVPIDEIGFKLIAIISVSQRTNIAAYSPTLCDFLPFSKQKCKVCFTPVFRANWLLFFQAENTIKYWKDYLRSEDPVVKLNVLTGSM